MRELHFVERTSEGGTVVLATSDGHEQFALAVDQALRDAIAGAPTAVASSGASKPNAEPRITPREIQVRVRGGEQPQEIADAFGAGLDWVLRFAGPVLAERERMTAEARRAKARRTTTEGQTVIFGEGVDERFAAHGIDPTSVRWDSHRRDDGQWIITANWLGGQKDRAAQWSFHLPARTVAPLDDAAADLLSDAPIRPIETPNLALVEFPADANTGPLPRAVEEVFDQAKYDSPVGANHPSHRRANFAAPAPQPPVAEIEPELPVAEVEPELPVAAVELDEPAAEDLPSEPPLPLHVPDAPLTARIPKITNLGAGRGESEEDKAARASIPSWDDILLGVRRKRD